MLQVYILKSDSPSHKEKVMEEIRDHSLRLNVIGNKQAMKIVRN